MSGLCLESKCSPLVPFCFPGPSMVALGEHRGGNPNTSLLRPLREQMWSTVPMSLQVEKAWSSILLRLIWTSRDTEAQLHMVVPDTLSTRLIWWSIGFQESMCRSCTTEAYLLSPLWIFLTEVRCQIPHHCKLFCAKSPARVHAYKLWYQNKCVPVSLLMALSFF